MNCDSCQARFSDHGEDRLDGRAAAAFRTHLDECEDCAASLARFLDATAALKRLRIAPTPPQHLAQIMRAVDSAARDTVLLASGAGASDDDFHRAVFRTAATLPRRSERGLLRRVGGYAATAMLGAAAALLIAARLMPPAPAAPAAPVAALEPAAQATAQDHGAPGPRVPASVPAYVPAYVPEEQIRFVSTGPLLKVDVDTEPVARAMDAVGHRAVDRIGASFESMSSSLDHVGRSLFAAAVAARDNARAEAAAAPPEAIEAAPAAAPVLGPAVASAAPALAKPLPLAAAAPARRAPPPVTVRRTGDRLALATAGALVDVVPRLLDLLDDPDAEVVELARDRLEGIRADLGLPAPGDAAAERGALAQFTDLFTASERSSPPQMKTDAERWAAWWKRHRLEVLDRETHGTW